MTLKNYTPGATDSSEVKPGLAVTETALLRYVLEMRYMSIDQVTRRFYDGGKVQESLKKLLDLEYLKVRGGEVAMDSLLMVTTQGYAHLVLNLEGTKLPSLTKNVFQPRVNHDLLLNELRMRFEDLNFISRFYSEAMLKEIPLFLREFKDLPDAVCKKMDDQGYFLELEVSGKAPKQYRERIAGYLRVLQLEEVKKEKITGVIFFCTDEKVMATIKAQIPEGTKGISVMSYHKYFKADQKPKLPPKPKKNEKPEQAQAIR